MGTEKCLIGGLIGTQCGNHKFIKNGIDVKDLSSLESKYLKYRVCNFPFAPNGVICPSHRSNTLLNYSTYQIKCSDPFTKHCAPIKNSLREVTLEICEDFYEFSNVIIPPGNKLCINCHKSVIEKITNYKTNVNKIEPEHEVLLDNEQDNDLRSSGITSGAQGNEPGSSQGSLGFITDSQELEIKEKKLKRILDSVDLPMPKKQKLSAKALEKQSCELAHSVYERSLDQINDTFKTKVNMTGLKSLQRDEESLNSIVFNIKSLYGKQSTVSEKIKVLTMFPAHWSYDEIKTHVKCTSYMIRKAKILREKKGKLFISIVN